MTLCRLRILGLGIRSLGSRSPGIRSLGIRRLGIRRLGILSLASRPLQQPLLSHRKCPEDLPDLALRRRRLSLPDLPDMHLRTMQDLGQRHIEDLELVCDCPKLSRPPSVLFFSALLFPALRFSFLFFSALLFSVLFFSAALAHA